MLIADKTFDCQPERDILSWLGIEPMLPRRSDDEHGWEFRDGLSERTISWLHQFRRLRTRWDRRPEVHQAFPDFSCWRHLLPHLDQRRLVLSLGTKCNTPSQFFGQLDGKCLRRVPCRAMMTPAPFRSRQEITT